MGYSYCRVDMYKLNPPSQHAEKHNVDGIACWSPRFILEAVLTSYVFDKDLVNQPVKWDMDIVYKSPIISTLSHLTYLTL